MAAPIKNSDQRSRQILNEPVPINMAKRSFYYIKRKSHKLEADRVSVLQLRNVLFTTLSSDWDHGKPSLHFFR